MFISFEHYNTVHTININHIISAEYQEPRLIRYDDDDQPLDPPRTIAQPASLRIATTEQVPEQIYDAVGQMVGSVTRSRIYLVTGPIATFVHNLIPRM